MTPTTIAYAVQISLNVAVLPVLINLANNALPHPSKRLRWLVWVAFIISTAYGIVLLTVPQSLPWLPTATQVVLTVVLFGTVLPILANVATNTLLPVVARRRSEIWLAVVVVSVGCAALTPMASTSRPALPICRLSPALASGCILSPSAGESVSREFEVTGQVAGIPKDKSLWLAVLINDMVWPKKRVHPSPDGRWFSTIIEGGSPPSGTFHLVLLMADSEDDHRISEWDDQGIRMDSWPGLESTPGSDPLAMVQSLTLSVLSV